MKVVLSSAPEAVLTKSYSPSLGLLYVAAVLEKEGFEVIIIDGQSEKFTVDQMVTKALKYDPLAFGVTGTTENRFNVINLLNKIKQKNKDLLTFWGGPHATLTFRNIMEKIDSVDVVVRGEGETIVSRLLSQYIKKESFENIPGIAYRSKGGKIIDTGNPQIIMNIDSIPWPARHLVNLKKYSSNLEGRSEISAVGIISSRGCPNDCSFCANVLLGQRVLRRRQPVKFVDELEFLHKYYGYRGFNFWDDTLTVDKGHIEAICNEIIKRGLDIVWYARVRVDTVDRDILSLMRKAGCEVLGFGIESGSERILNKINKKTNLAQIKQAVKISSELGFRVRCFFIFSMPEETFQDVQLTLNLMNELRSFGTQVECFYGFARIYPGTGFEQHARINGIIPKDFSWNNYFESAKSRFFEKTNVPLFENKGLSIKKIKLYIIKNNYSGKAIFLKGAKSLFTLKSFLNFKHCLYVFWQGLRKR